MAYCVRCWIWVSISTFSACGYLKEIQDYFLRNATPTTGHTGLKAVVVLDLSLFCFCLCKITTTGNPNLTKPGVPDGVTFINT